MHTFRNVAIFAFFGEGACTAGYIQNLELTWSHKVNKKNAALKLFLSRTRVHFFEINRRGGKLSCLQLLVSASDSLISNSLFKYMTFH